MQRFNVQRQRSTAIQYPTSKTQNQLLSWLLSWAPVLFCMVLIYYFSSRSVLPGPIAEPAPDGELYRRLIHMFEYAVLTGFLYRALAMPRYTPAQAADPHAAPPPGRPWLFGGAVAVALVYAILDEFHQSFVPNRDPSLRDIATDAAGVALALAAIALVSLIGRRRGGQGDWGGVRIVLVLPARSRGAKAREKRP